MFILASLAMYALTALVVVGLVLMLLRIYLELELDRRRRYGFTPDAERPERTAAPPVDDWAEAKPGAASTSSLVVFTDPRAAEAWSGEGTAVLVGVEEPHPLLAAASRCGSDGVVARLPNVELGVSAEKLVPRHGAVFCALPGERRDEADRPERYGDPRYGGAFVAMRRESCRSAIGAARYGIDSLESAFEGVARCHEVGEVLGVADPVFQGTHVVYAGGAVVWCVDPSRDGAVPTHSMRGGDPDPMQFYQVPGAKACIISTK
jgi:hypothetical protein